MLIREEVSVTRTTAGILAVLTLLLAILCAAAGAVAWGGAVLDDSNPKGLKFAWVLIAYVAPTLAVLSAALATRWLFLRSQVHIALFCAAGVLASVALISQTGLPPLVAKSEPSAIISWLLSAIIAVLLAFALRPGGRQSSQ